MVEGLVEVGLHDLSLVADELTVGGVGLGGVVNDTGEGGEAGLGLLGVGGHGVGQHDDLGGPGLLGALELVLGGEAGSLGGSVELTNGGQVGLLHVGRLLVESLGGLAGLSSFS